VSVKVAPPPIEGTAQAVPSLHVLPSSPISPRRTAPRPPSVPAAHPTKGCLCERTQRPLRLDDPRSAGRRRDHRGPHPGSERPNGSGRPPLRPRHPQQHSKHRAHRRRKAL